MRDALSAILVLLVGILIGVVYSQQKNIENDQQAVMEIGDTLKSNIDVSALDVEDKCSRQAAEFSKQSATLESQPISYVDHYNSQMRTCFVLTSSIFYTNSNSAELFTESDFLSDAFEQSTYGDYFGITNHGTTKIVECYVFSFSSQKVTCHSREEFIKLISEYLGPVADRA